MNEPGWKEVEKTTYFVVRKRDRNRYYGYRGPSCLEDFSDARQLSSEAEAVDLATRWVGKPLRVTLIIEDLA